jgi:hypothetical protein
LETTLFLTRVIGPVLIARGVSIVIDRRHFAEMLDGLEREVATISFSLFPIALMMAGIAIAITHRDTSTLAAILIHIMAWGAIAKSSMLILFPKLLVMKAQRLGKAGFINVVLAMCLMVGAYFTWFGYFGS